VSCGQRLNHREVGTLNAHSAPGGLDDADARGNRMRVSGIGVDKFRHLHLSVPARIIAPRASFVTTPRQHVNRKKATRRDIFEIVGAGLQRHAAARDCMGAGSLW
jgi:hypothetical protein